MKVMPYTMKVLHRKIKNQKEKMRVLHKEIKEQKHKMRVLLKPNVKICIK
jgi:hypothetical protein